MPCDIEFMPLVIIWETLPERQMTSSGPEPLGNNRYMTMIQTQKLFYKYSQVLSRRVDSGCRIQPNKHSILTGLQVYGFSYCAVGIRFDGKSIQPYITAVKLISLIGIPFLVAFWEYSFLEYQMVTYIKPVTDQIN